MVALQKKKSKWRIRLAIVLLAILCIGGVELMVCRVMDPALYQRITRPVAERLVAVGGELDAVKGQLFERVEAQEPPEEQLAASPDTWIDPASVADENLTKFELRGTKELLTGGSREITYYNQWDEAWSDEPFGSDRIGGYGCGPTVMAMAISSMTEQTVNPAELAHWAKENHHWAKKRGSYLSIIEGGAKAYGLCAEAVQDLNAERLRQEMASGKLMVALVSKGHFTQGGHFILLRGATLKGGILVADPSSRERSLMVWDAQLILDELSASRNDGAPLWSLSPMSSRDPLS